MRVIPHDKSECEVDRLSPCYLVTTFAFRTHGSLENNFHSCQQPSGQFCDEYVRRHNLDQSRRTEQNTSFILIHRRTQSILEWISTFTGSEFSYGNLRIKLMFKARMAGHCAFGRLIRSLISLITVDLRYPLSPTVPMRRPMWMLGFISWRILSCCGVYGNATF